MVEGVGKLNEIALLVLDGQLNLTKHIPVLQIDKNIVGSSLQPIDNPNQRKITLLVLALPNNLVVNPDDLLLP